VYHRNAFGGLFTDSPFDPYNINGVEIAYDMTPDDVKKLIDEAIEKDTWLVLYLHELVDGTPPQYKYNTKNFEEIIEYLALQPTQVKTILDVVLNTEKPDFGPNILPNGNFELGLGEDATGWVRNNIASVKILSDTDNKTTGTRHLQLTAGVPQNQIVSLPVSIDSAKKYQLSALSTMADYTTGSGNYWISEFDSSGAYINGQLLGSVTGNGMSTPVFIYTPNPGTAKVEIFIYSFPNNSFTWYVDNVFLKEVL
jgi:hypothetical protein